eukprot:GILJ01014241.1.p1 GENE.GILJ01014241.1~~GILJ01014241.1.p1  ORF type:complete len:231 (+),score=39.67 GILJ01014241.1:27-695(+)
MKMARTLCLCLLLTPFVLMSIRADAVCSEDELITELRQDIEDNGKLDCLRDVCPPQGEEEDEMTRNKRLAAQWDSDCAFEAEGAGEADWFAKLQNFYGVRTLVNVEGEPVEKDFDDQADMCEIIRALLKANKVPNAGDDVRTLNVEFVDSIDCAGAEGQTEVCAATGGSYPQKYSWYILLDGGALQLGDFPKFVISTDTPAFLQVGEDLESVVKMVRGAKKN